MMTRNSKIFFLFALCLVASLLSLCDNPQKQEALTTEPDTLMVVQTTDSLDLSTGLVIDDALPLVKGNCTGCHSAKLITQNRASREGWKSMIVWMQETQKLWDLGENEDEILDYLAKHYAPEQIGRRENLKDIEWYDLE
jgi:hypothetical protein